MALTYIVALSGKISPSGFYQNNTLTFEKGFSRNKFTWKRQAIYFFRERERERERGVRVKVFNATFNNISAISWRSVLLVEETRVHRENHRIVPTKGLFDKSTN
jgi:hypothetical protein